MALHEFWYECLRLIQQLSGVKSQVSDKGHQGSKIRLGLLQSSDFETWLPSLQDVSQFKQLSAGVIESCRDVLG